MIALLVQKIISGGQTGADRAALDWAIETGIPHGGWCPRSRKAEDGVIDPKYLLSATASPAYQLRTRQNVIDSDGTLILNLANLDGGTRRTKEIAERLKKPYMVVQLDADRYELESSAMDCWLWLQEKAIATLNVAGPRESKRPGTYAATRAFLDFLARITVERRETALISRKDALRIAVNAPTAHGIAESQLVCHEQRPRNCGAYIVATEPCWYIHAPWNDGLLTLRGSRLILVGKLTGTVHYDGAAHRRASRRLDSRRGLRGIA